MLRISHLKTGSKKFKNWGLKEKWQDQARIKDDNRAQLLGNSKGEAEFLAHSACAWKTHKKPCTRSVSEPRLPRPWRRHKQHTVSSAYLWCLWCLNILLFCTYSRPWLQDSTKSTTASLGAIHVFRASYWRLSPCFPCCIQGHPLLLLCRIHAPTDKGMAWPLSSKSLLATLLRQRPTCWRA